MARPPNLFDFAATTHALTPSQRKDLDRAARAAGGARKTGHAAKPGTGPEDQTCGSCLHYRSVEIRSGRTFRKCALMERHWTHGPGSDIRMKDAACSRWERSTDQPRRSHR